MPTKHNASLKHSQYYVEVLLRTDKLYEEGGEGVVNGLHLFDENWKNIEIGQKWAARQGVVDDTASSLVCEYPERGGRCLYLRQKPAERITWLEAALGIAHSHGFELVEAALHGKIGLALTEMGEYQKAIEHYSVQLEFAEKLNDFEGLGEGACNLGILYDNLDMLGPAQECYQYALDLAEKKSNQKITEVATGNLGLVYLKQGKFSEALNCFELHLQLAKQNGDQWSEGNALTNKGITCFKLQDYAQALSCLNISVLINRKLGDFAGEAKSLGYIGNILDATGDLDGAASAYHARIVLAQKSNDCRGQAIGHWNLGKTLIKQKKFEQGLKLLYKCIEYEKSIGDPVWEDDLKITQAIENSLDDVENV